MAENRILDCRKCRKVEFVGYLVQIEDGDGAVCSIAV